MPPLGLIQIASVTPDNFEIEIIDENVESLKFEETDVVGISFMTSSAFRAYEIADRYRDMGSTVILGGIHPSILPQEATKHADSVIIGEADEIWDTVIRDYNQNKLKKHYTAKHKPDLSKLPPLRDDLIKKEKYFFPNLFQTSRGCPISCDFCSVSRFNGTRVRHRPIHDVISEIEYVGTEGRLRRHVFFVDDNIVADPRYAKELFKALKPLNIKWGSQTSILFGKDTELMELAVESGCRAILIGFESISQDALREIHKGHLYRTREYKNIINAIHSCGVVLEGAFIFGLDSDDRHVFKRTVDFCYETNMQVAQFSVLTPFPGTILYERLEREGRILTRDWGQYDAFHTVFQPLQMSAEELQKGVEWSYGAFYSFASSIKRIACMLPKIGPRYTSLVSSINYDFHRFAG